MRTRAVAAVAVLVSAGVHLWLWFVGMGSISVIGPSFMFNAVAGLAISGLLMFWRHWMPLFLAVGFGASTLGAFVISTTIGLFGLHEQWVGVPVWAAAISESVAIAAGLLGLWREALSQHVADRRHASGSRLSAVQPGSR